MSELHSDGWEEVATADTLTPTRPEAAADSSITFENPLPLGRDAPSDPEDRDLSEILPLEDADRYEVEERYETNGGSSPPVQAVAESLITFDGDDASEGEGDDDPTGVGVSATVLEVADGGVRERGGERDGSVVHQPTDSTGAVSSITFHDLSYEVTQRKCCKRLPNKTILDSISGEMRTGLNAIMGPTGSGKTTLLDLLADRKDKSGRSGKVLMNGQKRPATFKKMVGYVVQDDVVMGTLSVRENLQFSAALRLPSHMTRAQRKKRVERVIDILGLYRCADTKIGTEFFRGVSGGERKRTNIGMELIIEPPVLFLDEPTTGLDAHTAVSVISLLKE